MIVAMKADIVEAQREDALANMAFAGLGNRPPAAAGGRRRYRRYRARPGRSKALPAQSAGIRTALVVPAHCSTTTGLSAICDTCHASCDTCHTSHGALPGSAP